MNEDARRHAQLLSVVEAKITEAAELRGRLKDISLALECEKVRSRKRLV